MCSGVVAASAIAPIIDRAHKCPESEELLMCKKILLMMLAALMLSACVVGDKDNDGDYVPYAALRGSYEGNNGSPSSAFPLGMCEADCDNDSECEGNLKCKQRDGNESVPGCDISSRDSGEDFCYDPGGDPDCDLDLGHTDYCRECGPCDEGEGDCDSDSDCRGDLVCVMQDGVDRCREEGDDDDDGPHLQVNVDGSWKGVDCSGDHPRVSNSLHQWDVSQRVLTHSSSGEELKCPEGREGQECTCSSSGERMHGGFSRGDGDVKDNLEKSDGGPIFPDADSGHHFLCLKFVESELIQVDVREEDCDFFRWR